MKNGTQLMLALAALTLAAGCGATTRTPARFVDAQSVVVQVEGHGTVTSPTSDVDCRAGSPEGCRADFGSQGPSLLSAKADPGWRFAGWRVGNADRRGSADPGFLPSMDGPRTRLYRAVFVRAPRPRVATAR